MPTPFGNRNLQYTKDLRALVRAKNYEDRLFAARIETQAAVEPPGSLDCAFSCLRIATEASEDMEGFPVRGVLEA